METDQELLGTRLRRLRDLHGESAEDLSRVLGCSRATIYHYEKGRVLPSFFDLEKIADHYGVSITYFLGRETGEDRKVAQYKRLRSELERLRQEVVELGPDYIRLMIAVPLIGTVPGGYPDFRDREEAEEFYPIRRAAIHPEGAYCLQVTGNSMIGRGIFDGDIVFVDKTLKPDDGDIVIARKGDEAVIRIHREDDIGPYLEAATKGYKRLRAREAEIIGVVVESRREHKRRNRAG